MRYNSNIPRGCHRDTPVLPPGSRGASPVYPGAPRDTRGRQNPLRRNTRSGPDESPARRNTRSDPDESPDDTGEAHMLNHVSARMSLG